MEFLFDCLPWLAAGYYAGTCIRCVACWVANGPRYVAPCLLLALAAMGLGLYGWSIGADAVGWLCAAAGFACMTYGLYRAGWYGMNLNSD